MKRENSTPIYNELAILADLNSYEFEYDWYKYDGNIVFGRFAINDIEFEVKVRVEGCSYSGTSHDPYYTYSGFRQTGLDVLSITVYDKCGDAHDITEGYEFSEAAQSIMYDNSNAFEFENWS